MPSKIYPNWDFWFENKPSGNPAWRRAARACNFIALAPICRSFRPVLRKKGRSTHKNSIDVADDTLAELERSNKQIGHPKERKTFVRT
jgi:hypothetical protein